MSSAFSSTQCIMICTYSKGHGVACQISHQMEECVGVGLSVCMLRVLATHAAPTSTFPGIASKLKSDIKYW